MNFTTAVYFLTAFNSQTMNSILMAVMSAGFTINPECWLKFPYNCLGCEFHLMKNELFETEYYENITIFSDVCSLIRGFEEDDKRVVTIDDESFLENVKHLVNYEPYLRPNFASDADVINVGFQLISIENLDLTHASFKLDFFLNQEWTDDRLQHNYPGVLDAANLGVSVWRPDTYFVQSRKSKYNSAEEGVFIKIHQNGHVYYGSRMSIEVSCPMDLHQFPMDVQECALELESYSFMHDEVIYNWSHDSISLNSPQGSFKALSQYDLKPISVTDGTSQYVIGNWSKLRMEFVFVRNSMIFIPAMYFPCAIIVFISWITFLLDVDHYSARTYLCVTSMLTIMTLQAAINGSLPWVSYAKAIDKYVMSCVMFIAGAFLEYACVLYIRSKKCAEDKYKDTSSCTQTQEESFLIPKLASPQRHIYHHGYHKKKKIRRRKLSPWSSRVEMYKKLHKKDHITLTKYERFIRFYLEEGWPKKLDVFSRMFFPMSFMVFNAFYWVSSGDLK